MCTVNPTGTITFVSAGQCSITASQAGNTSYAAATPVSRSFTVIQGATSTVVSTSAPSGLIGQSVSLTATVAPSTATGTVTFSDSGSVLCNNVPLVNGAATCAAKFASAGTHAVTASYNGSGNYAASSSQAVSIAITDQTGKTVTAIGGFLGARNNQILSNGFDESRQIDRLIEYGGGSTGGINGGGFAPASPSALGVSSSSSSLGGVGIASRLGVGPDASDVTRLGFGARGGALGRTDQPFAGIALGNASDYDPSQKSGVALPLRLTGLSQGAMSLGFSASLRDLYRFAGDTNAKKTGGLSSGFGASSPPKFNPFDIWIEGKYTSFRDASIKSNDLDGHFGIVTVGADYVLNKNLLVGAFVQFDGMQQRSTSQSTDVSGQGWMAGPYATVRLSDNVFWQSRAAWGTSSNTVSPFLTYTDSFDSERWLVSSTLSGRWTFGPWTFKPSASVSYIEDTSKAYHDTFGVLIPGVTNSLGQAKAGPEFSYRMPTANGGFVEPHAGAQLIWNFASDTTAAGLGTLNGTSTGPQGVRGRIELGVKMGSPGGVALDLSGSYDGIGSSGYDAVSGRAVVRIPLN